MKTLRARDSELARRLRPKQLAGRWGVVLLTVGTVLLLAGQNGWPSPVPEPAVSLVGWVALGLMFWASVCPMCGGPVTFDGLDCVSCRKRARTTSGTGGLAWAHVPAFGRLIIWAGSATLVMFTLLAGS